MSALCFALNVAQSPDESFPVLEPDAIGKLKFIVEPVPVIVKSFPFVVVAKFTFGPVVVFQVGPIEINADAK